MFPTARLATNTLKSLFVARPQPRFPLPLPSSSLSVRRMSSAVAKRLAGKTIVITGASSGIGKSTAFEFARTAPQDLKLVLTARRLDTLKQIAEEITKEVGAGVKVLPVKLDVSKPDEVRGFVQSLPEEFRDIDVLVNNAYAFLSPLPPSPQPACP